MTQEENHMRTTPAPVNLLDEMLGSLRTMTGIANPEDLSGILADIRQVDALVRDLAVKSIRDIIAKLSHGGGSVYLFDLPTDKFGFYRVSRFLHGKTSLFRIGSFSITRKGTLLFGADSDDYCKDFFFKEQDFSAEQLVGVFKMLVTAVENVEAGLFENYDGTILEPEKDGHDA